MKSPRCPSCHRPASYSQPHDAYYCPDCYKWLEDGCGFAGCSFCRERPEKPTEKLHKET